MLRAAVLCFLWRTVALLQLKSQRERANYGALALVDFADDLIHFQKMIFAAP
mgnify:CR=1 FL=1